MLSVNCELLILLGFLIGRWGRSGERKGEAEKPHWKIRLLYWITRKKVIYISEGKANFDRGGNVIVINRNTSDNYVWLHEWAHSCLEIDCCAEHNEFAAHQLANYVARALKIPIRKDSWSRAMNYYAGYTLCPRLEWQKESHPRTVKKREEKRANAGE